MIWDCVDTDTVRNKLIRRYFIVPKVAKITPPMESSFSQEGIGINNFQYRIDLNQEVIGVSAEKD